MEKPKLSLLIELILYDIICLTPKFNTEDDDIVYDEINLEIWPNGIDFIEVGKNYIKRTKN